MGALSPMFDASVLAATLDQLDVAQPASPVLLPRPDVGVAAADSEIGTSTAAPQQHDEADAAETSLEKRVELGEVSASEAGEGVAATPADGSAHQMLCTCQECAPWIFDATTHLPVTSA